MTGGIAAALALPGLVGDRAETPRALTAPPSFDERIVHVPGQALATRPRRSVSVHDRRSALLASLDTHPGRDADAGRPVRRSRPRSSAPVNGGSAAPAPTPAPAPAPPPAPAPAPAAPAAAPAPVAAPAAAAQPSRELASADSQGNGNGHGHGKAKAKGHEKQKPAAADAVKPPAGEVDAAAPPVAVPPAPVVDSPQDGAGEPEGADPGHGNGKDNGRGHGNGNGPAK